MADELELDDTPEIPKEHPIDKRINKALADKTKAEEARAKADETAAQAQQEAETAKKDAEFYKNFNTVTSKYQGASEFQDQIKERYLKGIDMEEAAIGVLGKEGKYVPPQAPPPPRQSPAGGSATTTITQGGEKPIGEMSQAERRAALMEAERRGDIGLI